MAARVQIVKSSIPQTGISRLRQLKFGKEIEEQIAAPIGTAFRSFMIDIAKKVALDWPQKTGKSAKEIPASARVTAGGRLDRIHGHFLVSVPIASHEYGTKVRKPVRARMMAIPIFDGVYPDGRPKRLGPLSWKSLGTFIYRSKRTGASYIAYKAGKELKIVYLLVNQAAALKQTRRFRTAYDRKLPELYAVVSGVLQTAIVNIYNQQFLDSLASINPQLRMTRVPSIIPTADIHAERLTPKY